MLNTVKSLTWKFLRDLSTLMLVLRGSCCDFEEFRQLAALKQPPFPEGTVVLSVGFSMMDLG